MQESSGAADEAAPLDLWFAGSLHYGGRCRRLLSLSSRSRRLLLFISRFAAAVVRGVSYALLLALVACGSSNSPSGVSDFDKVGTVASFGTTIPAVCEQEEIPSEYIEMCEEQIEQLYNELMAISVDFESGIDTNLICLACRPLYVQAKKSEEEYNAVVSDVNTYCVVWTSSECQGAITQMGIKVSVFAGDNEMWMHCKRSDGPNPNCVSSALLPFLFIPRRRTKRPAAAQGTRALCW